MKNSIDLPASAVSTDNELMLELNEYVKNPILFTQVGGNFSLMQLKIMESIIYQLQDHINYRLSKRSYGPLFANLSDEDLPAMRSGDLLTFQIPLHDLGVPRQKYGELDTACEALMSMKNTFYEYDPVQQQEVKVIKNIFHEVRVPTTTVTAEGVPQNFSSGKRRKGYIEIKMVTECASEILSLRKGYAESLFGVPRICHSARTPRLYNFLSAWREKGERSFPYNDLKEWFGVLRYNASRTKIEKDQFVKFAEFKRYCLEPAQKEMKKLAEEGRVDFFFEYEPIYKKGKTRGNPLSILFKIIEGRRGQIFTLKKRKDQIYSSLIQRWNITPDDWAVICEYFDTLPLMEVEARIEEIENQICLNKPDNIRAYAMSILVKWGTQRMKDFKAFMAREEERQEQERRYAERASVSGKDSHAQYMADLQAAMDGDEAKRLEYPNWEFLCTMRGIKPRN